MKSYVKKTPIQQKTLAPQEQNTQDNTFQLMSSQPNVQLHTQLQEQMNNSPQMLQMKAMQELASNNQQEQQVAQLQSAQGVVQRQEGTEGGSEQQENKTGLPDNLKSGVEALSGISMDDTKVHYNSDKPAQLQAHAYAQGNNIHLASGQEKHLPHEAWHVVQQKQGRVKPTTQLKGKVNINDDQGLEHEADVMGQKALQMQRGDKPYQMKRVGEGVAQLAGSPDNLLLPHNMQEGDIEFELGEKERGSEEMKNVTHNRGEFTYHHIVPENKLHFLDDELNFYMEKIKANDFTEENKIIGEIKILIGSTEAQMLSVMNELKEKGGDSQKEQASKDLGFLDEKEGKERIETLETMVKYDTIAHAGVAWMPGNIFHGPYTKYRDDDPGEGFETKAKPIVGEEQFELLGKLRDNLDEFDVQCKSITELKDKYVPDIDKCREELNIEIEAKAELVKKKRSLEEARKDIKKEDSRKGATRGVNSLIREYTIQINEKKEKISELKIELETLSSSFDSKIMPNEKEKDEKLLEILQQINSIREKKEIYPFERDQWDVVTKQTNDLTKAEKKIFVELQKLSLK